MYKRILSALALMFTAVMFARCADQQSVTPLGPQFGKAPPPSQVLIEFDDAFPATVLGAGTGVIGDGRAADGSVGPSAYQSSVCGVGGYYDQSLGQAQWDLYTATTCGNTRVVKIYHAPPNEAVRLLLVQNKSRVTGLGDMAVGESRTDTPTGFSINETNCARAMFSDAYAVYGSSNPLRTRIADDALGRRRWVVESRPPHTPACEWTDKRNRTYASPLGAMPFRYTITELK